MRYCGFLLAIPMLVSLVAPATADPKFFAVFKKEYLDKHPDKKYIEAVEKMDVRCLVCHQGKKSKKNRNAFGEHLDTLLDRKKDLKNDKKIADSIKKVLAMKVDPKNEKSETYMDRLKASKWLAGNLDDLKKEPKESAKEEGAEKKE
jgi:cytochrome c2